MNRALRLFSLLLALWMCVGLLPVAAWADTEEETDASVSAELTEIFEETDSAVPEEDPEPEEPTEPEDSPESAEETEYFYLSDVYVNPLYADVVTEEDLLFPSVYSLYTASETDGEYLSTEAELAQAIREAMKARQESFTLLYKTTSYSEAGLRKTMSEAFQLALAHTGVPTEGDYLRWQYAGYNWNMGGSFDGEAYWLQVHFTVPYYTSAEQESELDEKVASLINELDLAHKHDYEKISAIYDWMCRNIKYDYENLNDVYYTLKYTAYAALINKTSVCQGYATLFYRLALSAGVDTRMISGWGNGGGHSWNISKLNGLYYDLDATWDAVYADAGVAYNYFLRSDANFEDHLRDPDYASETFYAAYPMGSEDYVPVITHCWDDGTVTIKPSCTEAGEKNVTCTVCGETGTVTVPPTGHSWNEGVETTSPSCTDTGVKTFTCTHCGETNTEPLPATGHTEAIDPAVDPTCTEAGKTEGKHCTVCGEVLVKQEEIPANGHSWNEGVETTSPSCTQAGVKTFTCTHCGETSTEILPATGHTVAIDPAVDPTCTEAGKTEGRHCTVCGEVFLAQEEIAATGHSWDEGVKTTDPDSAGSCVVITYTCTACDETRTISIVIGDMNGDDKVGTKDVVLLMRHLAGDAENIIIEAADINRDGAVNAKDIVLLMRRLASNTPVTG